VYDLWFEAAVAVAGPVDRYRADLGQHRLGSDAAAGVAAVLAGRVVLVIAEVVGDLSFQGRLHDQLGQPLQQAALAGQLQAIGPGLRYQLTDELLIQDVRLRLRRVRVGHRVSIDVGGRYIEHQVSLLPEELHRCFYSPIMDESRT
jgi:hypothetical protein